MTNTLYLPELREMLAQNDEAGLREFFRWVEDPAGFVSREGELPEAQIVAARDTPGQARAREELILNPPRNPFDVLPIRLREELVVYVQNLPLDLSEQEAEKIGAVIRALATPARPRSQ